jgi:hypothetical protein
VAALDTMVPDAYVNHVPVLTGGVGRDQLKQFYSKHFIPNVQFRDGKLFNEHLYWDQASVLVQLGLLDPSTLPIARVETARKVADSQLT